MQLVEVVRTIATDPQVYESAMAFAKKLGKVPVRTSDKTGFIVNRLLVPYLLHGIFTLESGIASAEDIDTAMKLGCGHPMGPLALSDLIGLDVVRAARISAAGHGGQILISETTRALLGNQLPDGVVVHDLGQQHLKDVQHEHIYELTVDGSSASPKPLNSVLVSTRPVKYNISATPIATASTGSRFQMNNATATLSISRLSVASDIV